MTLIVYLHGFNSAFNPENEKVKALAKLGTVIGITYNSLSTYTEICQHLLDQLSDADRDDTVIVGTSLGAFWAAEMGSKLGIPSVIINPCYDPTNMLQKYIGPQTNYGTNKTESFELSSILSYMNCKTYDNDYDYLPLVILDMGDDVIDSFKTRELFGGFPMIHYADGSHRFDHIEDALDAINKYVNYCSFAENTNV